MYFLFTGRWAYNRGGGGGGLVSGWACKWQLTVFTYLSVSLEAVEPCQNLACY